MIINELYSDRVSVIHSARPWTTVGQSLCRSLRFFLARHSPLVTRAELAGAAYASHGMWPSFRCAVRFKQSKYN